MLGLQEVMERNRQRWREAVALAEPEPIKKKEFTSKCGLPRLDNYDMCKYPKEYWDKWPKYGLFINLIQYPGHLLHLFVK